MTEETAAKALAACARVAENNYGHLGQQQKAIFAANAKKVLKYVAAQLPDGGTARVQYNSGGPAVSGEIVLHADHVYVQMCADQADLGILGRTCKGQNDFVGGLNNWVPMDCTIGRLVEFADGLYRAAARRNAGA